jgi:hypothetical protein
MSDSKKPKLSEIYSLMASSRPLENKEGCDAILHLLDLVSRMGEALHRCDDAIEDAIYNDDGLDGAEGQRVLKEARELLKEISL